MHDNYPAPICGQRLGGMLFDLFKVKIGWPILALSGGLSRR